MDVGDKLTQSGVVGDITSAFACNEELSPGGFHFFDQKHIFALCRSRYGSHKSGGACPGNDGVVAFHLLQNLAIHCAHAGIILLFSNDSYIIN